MEGDNGKSRTPENLGGKKVNVLHLVYLSIIFTILTILFWTLSMNTSDDALRLFSFASSITSIVLAVVSIAYSLVSGKQVDASLGSISKTSEDIRVVGNDIQKIGNEFSAVSADIKDVAKGIESVNKQLNGEIEKITGLESNVSNILSSNENLSERVSELLNELRNTHNDVQTLGEQIKITQITDVKKGKVSEEFPVIYLNERELGVILLRLCLFIDRSLRSKGV